MQLFIQNVKLRDFDVIKDISIQTAVGMITVPITAVCINNETSRVVCKQRKIQP